MESESLAESVGFPISYLNLAFLEVQRWEGQFDEQLGSLREPQKSRQEGVKWRAGAPPGCKMWQEKERDKT